MTQNLPRNAGEIIRYHAERTIKSQSVGEHSWQVARILYAIWPEVPHHVIKYAIFHDVAEVVTGDVPCPAKVRYSKLKDILSVIESEVHQELENNRFIPAIPALSKEEFRIFKVAEYIEMLEFQKEEASLGNTNLGHMSEFCSDEIDDKLWVICSDNPKVGENIKKYIYEFMSKK